jgi:serine/threonine-protein kinase
VTTVGPTVGASAEIAAAGRAGGDGPPTQAVEHTPPTRNTTWFYGVLLVGLLVALLVVLFLLARSLGVIGGSGGGPSTAGLVSVPTDLVGQSAATAKTELTHLNLVPKEVDTPNATPAGQVFKVSPDPGTQLAKGLPVEIDVSTGPAATPFTTVPSVVGLIYPHPAGDQIVSAGFAVNPNIMLQASDKPYGTVLAQDPSGNSQGHQGDAVTLTVSSGPAPIVVPDVTGKTLPDATLALGQAGFKYTTRHESSSAVPSGDVTRTDPAANTQAAKGTVVTVYLSSGPSKVTVPNEVGATAANANAALTSKGFVVSEVTVAVVNPSQDGLVQSQTPAGGSSADQGSTVTIDVGKLGG